MYSVCGHVHVNEREKVEDYVILDKCSFIQCMCMKCALIRYNMCMNFSEQRK